MANESTLGMSELRYRRVFEAAKDGILILNGGTGEIEDANPFMTELLGYSHDQFLGKHLWEIGLFGDIEQSKAAFRELQEKGYTAFAKGGRLKAYVFIDAHEVLSTRWPTGGKQSARWCLWRRECRTSRFDWIDLN